MSVLSAQARPGVITADLGDYRAPQPWQGRQAARGSPSVAGRQHAEPWQVRQAARRSPGRVGRQQCRAHVLLLPLGQLRGRLPAVDLHLAMRVCSSRDTQLVSGWACRSAGPPAAAGQLCSMALAPLRRPHRALTTPNCCCTLCVQQAQKEDGWHRCRFAEPADPPAANPRLWGNCLLPRVTRLARGASLRRAATMARCADQTRRGQPGDLPSGGRVAQSLQTPIAQGAGAEELHDSPAPCTSGRPEASLFGHRRFLTDVHARSPI